MLTFLFSILKQSSLRKDLLIINLLQNFPALDLGATTLCITTLSIVTISNTTVSMMANNITTLIKASRLLNIAFLLICRVSLGRTSLGKMSLGGLSLRLFKFCFNFFAKSNSQKWQTIIVMVAWLKKCFQKNYLVFKNFLEFVRINQNRTKLK